MVRGRRSKYEGIISLLRDSDPYAPGMIAALANTHKILPVPQEVASYQSRFTRPAPTPEETVRASLLRFARRNNFPEEGDAKVILKGRKVCAWYGWRWKQAVRGPMTDLDAEISMSALIKTRATYRLREVAPYIPMDYDDLLHVMIHDLPEKHGIRYDPTADEVVISMTLFGAWFKERMEKIRPPKPFFPQKKRVQQKPQRKKEHPQPVPEPHPRFHKK